MSQPTSSARKAANAGDPVVAAVLGPLFWDALPSGRLLHDAPAWRAYTGQPEPLPESGWLDSVVHPEEREATVVAWARALQTGQPLSIKHRLRGADGVYRAFLTQARPLCDAAGEVMQWQGVSCELSELQHDNAARDWRAQTFAATTDAVIVSDVAGRIIDWNPAAEALFGYTLQEVLGRSSGMLCHTTPESISAQAVIDTIMARGVWQGERHYVSKEGREIRCDVTVHALHDDQGVVVGLLGVNRDITGRSLQETQYAQVLDQERAMRRDLESALGEAQAAEAKFRTVIDRNIIGIFVADADVIIEANDAFLQMLGYTNVDVLNREIRWADLTPTEWTVADDRASQELLTRGACAPYEKIYLHRDGRPIPIILAGVLLSLQPLRIMGFVLDITEREQLAREVAARAAELDAIFESMADGVYVYNMHGELTHTNAAARALNPFVGDEAYRHQDFNERIAQFALRDADGAPIGPEQTPAARIQRGERLVDLESQMRLPDGRDLQLSTSGGPIRDRDGTITGAVAVTRDVTARHRLEQQNQTALNVLLRAARIVTEPADTRDLLARLAEAVWQLAGVDLVHTMMVDDAQRLELIAGFGLPPAETLAWREKVAVSPPMTDPRILPAFRQLSDGHLLVQRFTEEAPLLTEHIVRQHHIRTAITAPILVEGRLIGLLSAARTQGAGEDDFGPWDQALLAGVGRLAGEALERARLAEQLAQADAARLAAEEATRERDAFLGVASHELRTPLTSIKANVQIVNRALDRFAQAKTLDTRLTNAIDLLRRTDRHINRLDRMVDDMLDMVRIQGGKLHLQPEPGNLLAVVVEAVEEQRLLWPDREISLTQPPDPVPVLMDSGRIGQVVTNYLVNALKYSPAAAPVAVAVTTSEGMARVAVRDHGRGIPLDQQALIWDRFYRAPGIQVESGSGVGLGLGLFVCRTLITRHGGATGVTSVPGQGATFWFTLPLV